MAKEYPYALTPEDLRRFVRNLSTVGFPDKVNQPWLATLGFKSKNHRLFPGILQFVGLIDASGRPTEKYKALREGDEGRRKLSAYIGEAYAQLFKVYPDADRKDTEALRNFFRARTTLGDRAVGAMAVTFQTLCSLALFNGAAGAPAEGEPPEAAKGAGETRKQHAAPRGGLIVNVNIQLELPATTEGDVYDKLFAAMARHILKFGEE
jgi:hypothetical protein